MLGDVVDQLEHVDGLAHAGTAEQADLTALRGTSRSITLMPVTSSPGTPLLVECRRRAVNWKVLRRFDITALSCGLPSTS